MKKKRSILKLLRRLPENIAKKAGPVLSRLDDHDRQSMVAERLVATWRAGGDGACNEMLDWYDKSGVARLNGRRNMALMGQHERPGLHHGHHRK